MLASPKEPREWETMRAFESTVAIVPGCTEAMEKKCPSKLMAILSQGFLKAERALSPKPQIAVLLLLLWEGVV